MLKRLKIAGVIFLLFVVGIIAFVVLRSTSVEYGKELYQSEVLGSNFTHSKRQGSKTIRFFTGTAIAEASIDDPSTSKSLTKEFGLGNTQKVVWTKAGALVKSGPLDELSPLLSTVLRNNPHKSFFRENATWWNIDITKNNISPVGVAGEYRVFIGDFCATDDKLYGTRKSSQSSIDSNISEFSLKSGSNLATVVTTKDAYLTPSIISCQNNKLVFRDGKGFLYTSINNLSVSEDFASNVVFATASGEDKIVFSQQEAMKESEDGDHDHSKVSNQSIKLYTISTGATEDIVDVENQKFFVVDNGLVVQHSGDSYRYAIHNLDVVGDVISHVVNVNKQSVDNTVNLIPLADEFSYVQINSDGDLSLINTDFETANIVSSNPPLKFKGNPIQLSSGQALYDITQNSVEVYFASGSSTVDQALKSSALELAKKTKDLNQVKKDWLYVGEFYD